MMESTVDELNRLRNLEAIYKKGMDSSYAAFKYKEAIDDYCINLKNNFRGSTLQGMVEEDIDAVAEETKARFLNGYFKKNCDSFSPMCEVGDKIYVILPDKNNSYVIKKVDVYEISWNQNGIFYKTYPSLPGITQDKFGKTVFLTQQNAENKMAELILKDEDYENEMI